MAHRQEEEQAARKKAGQGAVHEVGPEQQHGRTHPRPDEVFTDKPPEGSADPTAGRSQGESGRSGGGGQGRHDQGGDGRLPKDG